MGVMNNISKNEIAVYSKPKSFQTQRCVKLDGQ